MWRICVNPEIPCGLSGCEWGVELLAAAAAHGQDENWSQIQAFLVEMCVYYREHKSHIFLEESKKK